ncbi:MAG: hypothetical protein Kow0080_28730 [Candidatus Promineifilaceae bacterium]
MSTKMDLPIQLVQQLYNALNQGLDYIQICQIVTETAVTHLNHPHITQAILLEHNPQQKSLHLKAAVGLDKSKVSHCPPLLLADYPALSQPGVLISTNLPFLDNSQADNYIEQPQNILHTPLIQNDQLTAVIIYLSTYPDTFTQEITTKAHSFSQLAALILETARIVQDAQNTAKQAQAINEITRAVNANLDLDTILEITDQEVSRLIPHARASLALPVEHNPNLLQARPLKGQVVTEKSGWTQVSARDGGVGQAYTTGKPFLAADLNQETHFEFDNSLRQSGIRSYICLPLIQNNKVVGTLNLGSTQPHDFGPHNLPILKQISQQLAIAINNAHLFALAQRRVAELDMLNDISRALSSTLEVPELLEIIYQQTQRVLNADNLYIALYDEQTGEIDFAFLMHEGQRQPGVRIKAPKTLTQYIINTGQALFLQGDLDAKIKELGVEPGGKQPKIWLGVPMLYQGRAIGVISIQHYHDPNAYDHDQLRLLQAVANQAATSLQNAHLLKAARQRAAKEAARRAVLTAANRKPDLKAMLDETLTEMMSITNLESGWIFLCLHQQPEIAVYRGISPTFIRAEAEAAPQCKLCQKIIDQSEGNAIMPLDECPYLSKELIQNEGLASHLSAAIVHQGNVVGIINLATRDKSADLSAHLPLLSAIGEEIGAAVMNAHLYQTVQREQRKLAAILNDTADLVLVLDEDGRILLTNRAIERTLKIQEKDVINKPLTDLGIQALSDALTAAQQADTAIVCEVEITKECVLYASVSPVHDVGWVMVLQDITSLKELDQLRTEWVASVSHDLKNPLAIIKLSADLLAQAGPLNEKQRSILERVKFGTERLRSLVTDMLDLARMEMGATLQAKPVNLHQIIANALQEIHEISAQKQQIVSVNLPPVLPQVSGDEVMLRQLLVNLLTNASKYTPPHGKITVQVCQDGDYLQVQVIDTGRGIPPESIPHLFDRFYRVPGSEINNEGTGLGLSIVKMIVEKHHGRIHVTSEMGVGTTFTFTLPTAH